MSATTAFTMFCILLFVILFVSDGLAEENNTGFSFTFPKEQKDGCLSPADVKAIFGKSSVAEPNSKKFNYFKINLFCQEGYGGIGSECLICDEESSPPYHANILCKNDCEESDNFLFCAKKSSCFMVPKKPEQKPVSVPAPITCGQTNRIKENYEECGLQDLTVRRLLGDRQRKASRVPQLPTRHRRQSVVTFEDQTSFTLHEYSPAGARLSVIAEVQWHAGIYTKRTRPYMQICGGTIVSHNVVISAAHCFWSEEDKQLPASDYAVAVGKLYRPWNDPQDEKAQKSDVADIKIPPFFKGHATNLQEDIAIVIVKTPFKFIMGVRPACLDFSEEMDQKYLEPNTLGTVAGWGLTSEDGAPTPVLQIVELPVVDIQECFQQSDPKFRGHLTSDKFCAGWNNGTAVCKGDSGGGFFVQTVDEGEPRYFLRGIVSGAPQNEHLCNVYTWASFTRVSKHESFIKKAMEEAAARVIFNPSTWNAAPGVTDAVLPLAAKNAAFHSFHSYAFLLIAFIKVHIFNYS